MNSPVQIISQHDDLIARINPDASWSVKWDDVITQAYEPFTRKNVVTKALSQVLLAGRDNFLTTRWDDPQEVWSHDMITLRGEHDYDIHVALTLSGPRQPFGCIDGNGVWSVNWDEVEYTYLLRDQKHFGYVAVDGFCRLLLGARDNFRTQPFPKDVI